MIPITIKAIDMKWILTVFLSNSSRPNFGQIRVRTMPMKNIASGSSVSVDAEAMAKVGAVINAPR